MLPANRCFLYNFLIGVPNQSHKVNFKELPLRGKGAKRELFLFRRQWFFLSFFHLSKPHPASPSHLSKEPALSGLPRSPSSPLFRSVRRVGRREHESLPFSLKTFFKNSGTRERRALIPNILPCIKISWIHAGGKPKPMGI